MFLQCQLRNAISAITKRINLFTRHTIILGNLSDNVVIYGGVIAMIGHNVNSAPMRSCLDRFIIHRKEYKYVQHA